MKIINIAKLLVICGIVSLASCSEKEDVVVNENNNSKSATAISISEIESMSAEIADFHDVAMQRWISDMSSSTSSWDDTYYANVVELLKSVANQYNFSELDKSFMISELANNTSTYSRIANIAIGSKADFITYFTSQPQTILNTNLVLQKTNTIFDNMEDLFIGTKSYEEFEEKYHAMVDLQLSDVSNMIDYSVIRFYADLALSSLNTWGNYFFGTGEYAKADDKRTWYEAVWDCLVYTWDNYIQPPVEADLEAGLGGAVEYLLSGNSWSWAGFGSSFATGAAVGSIRKVGDMIND